MSKAIAITLLALASLPGLAETPEIREGEADDAVLRSTEPPAPIDGRKRAHRLRSAGPELADLLRRIEAERKAPNNCSVSFPLGFMPDAKK